MKCINCGNDITLFYVDSDVAGRIDVGFQCDDCDLVVWTHKVERASKVFE